MSKLHINDAGDVKPCTAKRKCRYGEYSRHFEDIKTATTVAERYCSNNKYDILIKLSDDKIEEISETLQRYLGQESATIANLFKNNQDEDVDYNYPIDWDPDNEDEPEPIIRRKEDLISERNEKYEQLADLTDWDNATETTYEEKLNPDWKDRGNNIRNLVKSFTKIENTFNNQKTLNNINKLWSESPEREKENYNFAIKMSDLNELSERLYFRLSEVNLGKYGPIQNGLIESVLPNNYNQYWSSPKVQIMLKYLADN